MKKTLVFENTYFSLFVFFLYDENWKNYDYLLWGNRFDHDFVKHLSTYVNVLEQSYQSIPRLITKSSHSLSKYYSDKVKLRRIINKYDACIGNVREINDPFTSVDRVQIDDGTGTHLELVNGPKKKSSFFAFFSFREGVKISRTSKFILTKQFESHSDYRKKCEFINIRDEWNKKTESDKKELLNIFGVSYEDFSYINNSSSILFTQPLSENRSDYSELDKINGYKHLINMHGIKEKDIIIKPHPAEKTDYSHYFPNATIIKSNFPAELIALLDVKLDKVLSVTTTAGECFKGNCNLVYYAKGADFFNFPESVANRLNSMDL
ncbi:glycosyltransferase family 52 [Vibrio comitans]|uniref:Lipooligosaccharide sialyltransferase n=1 Tax=Vibrio comitans NBRC 102076 TaxID=1219078 RepID=A0A4Y3IPG0_9VIBR|nr:glycosyltransferase family 52 [Vibrio comitans]GEA61389.1 hypothetical protein VCO01S_25820 [Vibrio comitans NBRC 102076]